MTSPYSLNSGPPELPELTVQSVCSTFITLPSLMVSARSSPETVPEVSVFAKVPRALPMAVTVLPTVSWPESPSTTGLKLLPSADSILMIARSASSSPPT